jgi:lanosterol synthase
MQCSDGGYASYELTRGPQFLESLNVTEIFGIFSVLFTRMFTKSENEGNVMVEHTYPECTTSVITALRVFQRYYPAYRKKDIEYVTGWRK